MHNSKNFPKADMPPTKAMQSPSANTAPSHAKTVGYENNRGKAATSSGKNYNGGGGGLGEKPFKK